MGSEAPKTMSDGQKGNAGGVNTPLTPLTDRFRGCLLGLAAGDAVGTTVEFKRRGTFTAVTDMVGGGPFRLEPGQWTDDTSMALCLATSLVERGGFDAKDQMDRYVRWHERGYLSSNGECFDIGTTVSGALARYKRTGEPFQGRPTRIRPATAASCAWRRCPMWFYPDVESMAQHSAESSRTTHGTAECLDACRFLSGVLYRAFEGRAPIC